MGIASFILGVLSLSGVCLALIPFVNLLNCLTLPAAFFGGLLGLLEVMRDRQPGESRALAMTGLALNLTALVLGGGRFLISLFTTGGIF